MSEKRGSFILVAIACVLLAGILLFQVYNAPSLYPEVTTNLYNSKAPTVTVPSINGPVNLNTASLEELISLEGVGEAKARAIIEYREEYGGFDSVDELLNVKGIGETILEKNRDKLTV